MSAEIHRLTAAGPITEPDPVAISVLETLLAEARAGNVKGLGVFWVDAIDVVTTSICAGCARCNDVVAGAAMLQHRVMK